MQIEAPWRPGFAAKIFMVFVAICSRSPGFDVQSRGWLFVSWKREPVFYSANQSGCSLK